MDNINYIKEDNKRCRKYNAIKLPNGIQENMIPKYVSYYKECYNKEKNLFREFFKIEKHPKSNKIITSSKSNKINILDKLIEIKEKLKLLECNTEIEIQDISSNHNQTYVLPKYVILKTENSKNFLIYDKKKINELRETAKILYNKNLSFEKNIDLLKEKISLKYNYNINE